MRFPIAISLLSVLVYAIKEEPTKLQIGIKKRIPEKECTRKAAHGDNVKVHYVGTLFSTGEEFDSSRSRNVPFDFKLGAGMVIKGWDQGVVGMCVGELRKLVIPYNLAYGESGSPPKIPAKATLVFEVELVELPALDESKEDDEEFDTDMDGEQVEL